MPVTVSIMVAPTGSNDALPQLLLDHGGVWRDMSPPLDVRMLVSVSEIRQRVDSLLVDMMSQIRSNQVPSWAAMRAAFKRHYIAIVPSGIHTVLQEALVQAAQAGGEPPLLRIHTHPSTEWIPWEVLNDGTDFLGMRFQIARLPIMPNGPEIDLSAPHPVRRVFSFLGKNVFNPTLSAQLTQSWKDTFTGLLPAGVQSRLYPSLNGVAADFPNVDHIVDAADEGDILHITCHGGMKDKDGQFYWTLNHESLQTFSYHINPTLISDLKLVNAPLVFGNACTSSQPADGQGGLAAGFGSQFFAQGALAFIGAFAPLTQQMAVNFAKQFYQRLLGAQGATGQPVARALFETKRYYASQSEIDPSYLYYSLYGPAETVFQVA